MATAVNGFETVVGLGIKFENNEPLVVAAGAAGVAAALALIFKKPPWGCSIDLIGCCCCCAVAAKRFVEASGVALIVGGTILL